MSDLNPGGYDNVKYGTARYDDESYGAELDLALTQTATTAKPKLDVSLSTNFDFTPNLFSSNLDASEALVLDGEFAIGMTGEASISLDLIKTTFAFEVIRQGATLYPLPAVPVPVD